MATGSREPDRSRSVELVETVQLDGRPLGITSDDSADKRVLRTQLGPVTFADLARDLARDRCTAR